MFDDYGSQLAGTAASTPVPEVDPAFTSPRRWIPCALIRHCVVARPPTEDLGGNSKDVFDRRRLDLDLPSAVPHVFDDEFDPLSGIVVDDFDLPRHSPTPSTNSNWLRSPTFSTTSTCLQSRSLWTTSICSLPTQSYSTTSIKCSRYKNCNTDEIWQEAVSTTCS